MIANGNDSIIKEVIEKIKKRREEGFSKYVTNLDRKDLSLYDWLQHLQEELMDAVNYIEKIKSVLNETKQDNWLPMGILFQFWKRVYYGIWKFKKRLTFY
mgnify:CR=1 FL=1